MIQRVIGFGIHAAGCLYAGYWAIFFGSVAFLIISSYLREHGCAAPRSFVGTGQVQRRIISWELARGVRLNLTRGHPSVLRG